MATGTVRNVQVFDKVLRMNIAENGSVEEVQALGTVVQADLFNWKDGPEFVEAHGQFDLVVGADM
jgi:hypothetical protein